MLKRLFIIGLFLLIASPALASGFQLQYIGGLDTQGATYSEWWYSTENPSLSGITTAGDSVSVTIDGTANSATVDASGNWSYSPSTLTAGDHTVAITGSAGSLSFTLHIGSTIPANVTAPSASDMPVAGIIDSTLALWLVGGLLLTLGLFVIPNKTHLTTKRS
jgi:Big-like domain-containing protein